MGGATPRRPHRADAPASGRVVAQGGDANLFVTARKYHRGRQPRFEGSFGYALDAVSHGWQRLAHRRLDEARSQPWQPVHNHDRPEPAAPGEIVPVDVALLAHAIPISSVALASPPVDAAGLPTRECCPVSRHLLCPTPTQNDITAAAERWSSESPDSGASGKGRRAGHRCCAWLRPSPDLRRRAPRPTVGCLADRRRRVPGHRPHSGPIPGR